MGNGTDMEHRETDDEKRAREWYAWEKERNERRRNLAIARGCAVVLLVVAAILLWIGFMSVLDALDAL